VVVAVLTEGLAGAEAIVPSMARQDRRREGGHRCCAKPPADSREGWLPRGSVAPTRVHGSVPLIDDPKPSGSFVRARVDLGGRHIAADAIAGQLSRR